MTPAEGFYVGSGRRYHASACHMIAKSQLASVEFISADRADYLTPCQLCAPSTPERRDPSLEYAYEWRP